MPSTRRIPGSRHSWQILSFLALLPYVTYLFWRGNYGHFFSYYLTSHFILLLPLMVFALRWLSLQSGRHLPTKELAWIGVGLLLFPSLKYAYFQLCNQENQAGLQAMSSAITQMYRWQEQDTHLTSQTAFRIFTPNGQTENFDYLLTWKARQKQRPVPLTVKHPETQVWYILVEPDLQIPEKRLLPWYDQATQSGVLTRQAKLGQYLLETWMKPEIATQSGLQPLPPGSILLKLAQ